MSFPIVPLALGSGLLALIAAGQADKKSASSSSSATATPTTQSTGGPDGGAQAPSHADQGNATLPGNTGIVATPVTQFVEAGVEAASSVNEAAPIMTAPGPATLDPWKPEAGPSITSGKADAVKSLGTVAGLTTRAVADTFQSLGSTFGSIW